MSRRVAASALCLLIASTTAAAQSADVARVEAGKQVFRAFCWNCHGLSGGGNGPMAKSMALPAPDFRKPDFQWDTDGDGRTGTDADLRNVVTYGVARYLPACALTEGGPDAPARCAMAAWGEVLSAEQIGQVIAYVRSLERIRPRNAGS